MASPVFGEFIGTGLVILLGQTVVSNVVLTRSKGGYHLSMNVTKGVESRAFIFYDEIALVKNTSEGIAIVARVVSEFLGADKVPG